MCPLDELTTAIRLSNLGVFKLTTNFLAISIVIAKISQSALTNPVGRQQDVLLRGCPKIRSPFEIWELTSAF
jgi:hypothetical protein